MQENTQYSSKKNQFELGVMAMLILKKGRMMAILKLKRNIWNM